MNRSVGFIGVGNMGSAIIKGLAAQKLKLHGFDLDSAKLKSLAKEAGLKAAASPADVVKACRYVVLAVKPQHLAAVVKDIAPKLTKKHCLLSIAAGVTQDKLRTLSGSRCPVVRIMPNTPALVGAGVFALCFDDPAWTTSARTSCAP